MRSSTLILIVLGVALAVLVGGGLVIWYQDDITIETPPDPAPVVDTVEETPAPPPTRIPPAQPANPPETRVEPPPAPLPQTPPAPAAVPPNTPEPEAPPDASAVNWEDQVARLMASNLDEMQKSVKLVEMMSQMPETNQLEATEYLAGLVPDQGYAAVVPMLTNPQTSAAVVDVLMVDLLDRPSALQLPLFLNIARSPNHPRHEEAKEYLELSLGEDFGDNWSSWEQAVQQHLQANPD